jgi:hypothetical protein
LTGSVAGVDHDGNRCGRGLGSSGGSFAADRDDDSDLAANKIGRQRRHPVVEVDPRSCYVANVPLPAISRWSFDHFVGAQQDWGRDRHADRLGDSGIDDQFKFGRLLDWRIRPV